MGVLESRLVIRAVDETAAAFASAEARVSALNKAVAGSGRMTGAAATTAARIGATESAIRSSGTMMGAIAGAASHAAGLAHPNDGRGVRDVHVDPLDRTSGGLAGAGGPDRLLCVGLSNGLDGVRGGARPVFDTFYKAGY